MPQLKVREVVKLHAIIQWGLYQRDNQPKGFKSNFK